MDKKTKTLSIAASTALATTLALGAAPANAAANPFMVNDLGNGYQHVAEKKAEGTCGSSHAKDNEGKCGGDKKAAEEKKKEEKKKAEGKCGEGKCGGDKK